MVVGIAANSGTTLPSGRWLHMPKEPKPVEPDQPIKDPQPYTDPVQSPPGDPNEERPMRDPIEPGRDRPRV